MPDIERGGFAEQIFSLYKVRKSRYAFLAVFKLSQNDAKMRNGLRGNFEKVHTSPLPHITSIGALTRSPTNMTTLWQPHFWRTNFFPCDRVRVDSKSWWWFLSPRFPPAPATPVCHKRIFTQWNRTSEYSPWCSAAEYTFLTPQTQDACLASKSLIQLLSPREFFYHGSLVTNQMHPKRCSSGTELKIAITLANAENSVKNAETQSQGGILPNSQ